MSSISFWIAAFCSPPLKDIPCQHTMYTTLKQHDEGEFVEDDWLMHRLTNEQTGVSGSSPALILALWTMSLIPLMQLSTPTNYKWIEKKSYIHIHTQVHTSWLKYILKHVLWSHPVIGTWSICLSEDVSLSRNQYCFRVCPTAVKVENIVSHSFLWSYWHFLCSNNWHEARS